MEQGPNEARIIEQARKMGMPLPDSIIDKPSLVNGLEFYWKAFSDLSSDRDIGMGEGPIPWSAIHQWGTRNKIWGDDFERLTMIIRGMDEVYLNKRSSDQKKRMGKSRGKSSRSFNKSKALGRK